MDCILCYRVFIKEREFQNYNPNLELCKKTLLDLFGISRNPDVQGLSEDLLVCLGCSRKLEEIGELVTQLKEIQRRVDQVKIEIKQGLIDSKKVSQVMAKDSGDCMSKSSLDRLVLLKAIEASGNTHTPTFDHDGIDAQHPNDVSFEAQVTPATVEAEIHNSANDREGNLPIRALRVNELSISSKRVQNLPGMSTGSLVASSSKSKTLRNQMSASNENIASNSEPGDGSSSEDDTDGGANHRSKGLAVIQGKQPIHPRGHILKEFTRLKNGLQCNHCFKIFTKKGNLKQHSKIHQPRSLKCPVQDCGKRFTYKHHRDSHVKNVHEKRRDFRCTWTGCEKKFFTKHIRDMHVKVIHDKSKFKCSWAGCGQSFTHPSNLARHVKIIHEGRREFKCGVGGCGKAFGTKRELQIHMSRKHKKMAVDKKQKVEVARVTNPQAAIKELKVQVFECRITPSCGRIFLSEGSRNAHEESHAKN